ncbi:hypothetical protein D3C81_1195880 [compost metagenome]
MMVGIVVGRLMILEITFKEVLIKLTLIRKIQKLQDREGKQTEKEEKKRKKENENYIWKS